MKLATLDETKACLSAKLVEMHNSTIDYYKAMHQAMRDAVHPALDIKLSELTGRLNELEKLASQNQFSIGMFLCDLVLSVAITPVLGTVVGRLVAGPLVNIIAPRSRMLRLSKRVERRGGKNPESANTTESRGSQARILAAELFSNMPSSPIYELDDVATGVVVDAFQLIHDKVLGVLGEPPGLIPFSHKGRLSAYDPLPNRVDTESEYVDTRADRYLLLQTRATEATTRTQSATLANISDKERLAEIQEVIDKWNAGWKDYNRERASWEMQNFTKMILVLLYFGDPNAWIGDGIRRDVSAKKKFHYEFALDSKLPPETRDILVSNFMVPGNNVSYLVETTRLKQSTLRRKNGPGIDQKGSVSGDDIWGPGPVPYGQNSAGPYAFVPTLSNELFNAKETAFYRLFSDMQRLYKQVTSKGHDVAFQQMMERNRPTAGAT